MNNPENSYLEFQSYCHLLEKLNISEIYAHITLGSGFGECLKNQKSPFFQNWQGLGTIHFQEIIGLKKSTVMDHQGAFHYYKHKENPLLTIQVQSGRIHGYEGHSAREVIKPVMLACLRGTKKFILTNAAGGINLNYKTGEAMILSDHVNLTGQNPLIGPNPVNPVTQNILGPRFPDLSVAYNKIFNSLLSTHLKKHQLNHHQGVYLGILGPSFETPAEIKLFQRWGMDAVGMSTIWEVIALTHAQVEVNAISLISNMACGLSSEKLDHETILETCRTSSEKIFLSIIDSLLETATGDFLNQKK